jgi:hypothetical protein
LVAVSTVVDTATNRHLIAHGKDVQLAAQANRSTEGCSVSGAERLRSTLHALSESCIAIPVMEIPMAKSQSRSRKSLSQPQGPGESSSFAKQSQEPRVRSYQQPVPPEEQAPAAFSVPEAAEAYGVDRALIEAQRELEHDLKMDDLAADPAAFSLDLEEDDPRVGLDNIIGTAIGIKEREGQLTGEVVLKVFVREKVSDHSLIVEGQIKTDYHGIRTDVEEVIEGSAYDRRIRPAPCGSSVGRAGGPIGTIGCLGERGDKGILLSNNHVLAGENSARRGAAIVQPGGGSMPRDWIGYLEEFVPLRFDGTFNTVDAAIAWVPTDGRFVVPNHQHFTIDPVLVPARLGMVVKKEGRTTGSTLGMVRAINATRRNIRYGAGFAHFRSVVVVTSTSPSRPFFGQPGDSGSLIVESSTNRPVALLFGGGGFETFGNPIDEVTRALQIRLVNSF